MFGFAKEAQLREAVEEMRKLREETDQLKKDLESLTVSVKATDKEERRMFESIRSIMDYGVDTARKAVRDDG